MNIKIIIHSHVRKDGTAPAYLRISSEGKEFRHPLHFNVPKKNWDPEKQEIRGKSEETDRLNLIINNIKARINLIRTTYYLKHQILTAKTFINEYQNNIPKVDFLVFFENEIKEEGLHLNATTIKRHKKVLRKLKLFRPHTLISDVDEKYINNYIGWCRNRGNKETTIAGNIAVIKKYIRIAIKRGISTSIKSDEIKVKRIGGMRENLSLEEVRILTNFYEKKDMNEIRQHALGLFLFSCWTGLRISDLKKLTRSDLANDYILIEMQKGKKPVRIPINAPARKLANSINWDLSCSEQKMRDELYIVRGLCEIKKKVTFHIGRHTFATNYYRKTKDLLMLQNLLGHTNVRETMIYTHIVDMEDDDGIHKMGLDF